MSIKTFEVNATVDIDGVEFDPTYVEVNRSAGGSASEAKLKGLVDDIDSLKLDQQVTVSVYSRDAGGTIFTGKLKKATVDDEAVVTVMAYDNMIELHNHIVKLNTERPRYATHVARDLLDDAGFDDAYVAPRSSFPGGDTRENRTYGSAKQGESLYSVLNDLAMKLSGILWVDEQNVIRLESYPNNYTESRVPFIIDLHAGSDGVSKNKVVVKGGAPVGQLGQAAYMMYSNTAPSSTAYVGQDEPEGPSEKRKALEDSNVNTKRGTEKMAMSHMLREVQSTSGSIKIVGNPAIGVFDRVIVPQLKKQKPEDTGSVGQSRDSSVNLTNPEFVNAADTTEDEVEITNPAFVNDADSGEESVTITNPAFVNNERYNPNKYSVTGITHVIDTMDGYTTTVELSTDPVNVLSGMKGVPGELAEEYMETIKDKKQDGDLLGAIPGF